MWDTDITEFLRFCYLNIPCLKINITLTFILSSSYELMDITRIKTQKQIFLLVSGGHICTPQRDTWRLHTKPYKSGQNVSQISCILIIAQT